MIILLEIFCYSNNPSDIFYFPIYNATFFNVDIKECIVHFPKGKTSIYKEAKGWRDFNSIFDDDSHIFLSNIELSDNSEDKHVKISKLLNLSKYLNL